MIYARQGIVTTVCENVPKFLKSAIFFELVEKVANTLFIIDGNGCANRRERISNCIVEFIYFVQRVPFGIFDAVDEIFDFDNSLWSVGCAMAECLSTNESIIDEKSKGELE